jgi:hypothetical protein
MPAPVPDQRTNRCVQQTENFLALGSAQHPRLRPETMRNRLCSSRGRAFR